MFLPHTPSSFEKLDGKYLYKSTIKGEYRENSNGKCNENEFVGWKGSSM
jgi:hypothetical protein